MSYIKKSSNPMFGTINKIKPRIFRLHRKTNQKQINLSIEDLVPWHEFNEHHIGRASSLVFKIEKRLV